MCLTLGHPRQSQGVVYSHRSTCCRARDRVPRHARHLLRDVVMPVGPCSSQRLVAALSAPMAGASLAMPGPKLDGASIYELLTQCG